MSTPGKATITAPPGSDIKIPMPKGASSLTAVATAIGATSLQSYKNQMFFALISLLALVGAGFVLFSNIPALLTAGYSILTAAIILSGIVFVIVNIYQLVGRSGGILDYIFTIVPYLFLLSIVISILALYASYGDIVERDIVKVPLIRSINNIFAVLVVIMVIYHLYHQVHIMDINIIPSTLAGVKSVTSGIGSNDTAYFIIMVTTLGICAALLNTMYAQIMYHTTDG
jgi:hypothetical protein